MKWKEIQIKTTHQAYPAVVNLLEEMGITGTSTEKIKSKKDDLLIKAYVEIGSQELAQMAEELRENILSLPEYSLNVGSGKVKTRAVEEMDWAANWKKHFHPIKLTEQFVVKPTWEDYSAGKGEIVIEIDPGQAFGTGYHATTAECMKLLESYLQPGVSFLDLGTGTGILAIAAAKLGAEPILALDIDSKAVITARENARVNKVDDEIEFIEGDLTSKVNRKYQAVAANILPEVIMDLIPQLDGVLTDEGCFILSGIKEKSLTDIELKLQEEGFKIETTRQEEDWIALAGSRS